MFPNSDFKMAFGLTIISFESNILVKLSLKVKKLFTLTCEVKTVFKYKTSIYENFNKRDISGGI